MGMRANAAILAFLFFTAALATSFGQAAQGGLAKGAVFAEIVYAQGDDIVILGSGRQRSPGDPIGERLSVGDQIQTGAKTTVEIVLMPRKSRIRLSENTIATIRELSSDGATGIELLYGRIRSKVAKAVDRDESFNVRTSSVVAAVRGTDFGCDVILDPTGKAAPTKVYCFEGSVDVAAAETEAEATESVLVEAGAMAVVSPAALGKAPEIRRTAIDADTLAFWKMNEFTQAMPAGEAALPIASAPAAAAAPPSPAFDLGPVRKGISAKNGAILGSAALFLAGAALGGTAYYIRDSDPELSDTLMLGGLLTASLAVPSLVLAISIDPLAGMEKP